MNTDALTCLSQARARHARLVAEINAAANGGAFALVAMLKRQLQREEQHIARLELLVAAALPQRKASTPATKQSHPVVVRQTSSSYGAVIRMDHPGSTSARPTNGRVTIRDAGTLRRLENLRNAWDAAGNPKHGPVYERMRKALTAVR